MDLDKRNNIKVKEIIEKYWKYDFNAIQLQETKRRDRMKKQIDLYHILSMLCPSTSWLATTQNLSGGGYKNVINFYDYVCGIKEEFVRFYLDKKFYTDEDKVENFVKNESNLYRSKIILSLSSIAGLGLTVLYAMLLYFAVYFRCKRNLFCLEEKDIQAVSRAAEGKIELTRSEPNVWKVKDMLLAVFFYIFFTMGHKGITAKKGWETRILLDEVDITQTKCGGGFLYICSPDDIPGRLSMDDFIMLVAAGMKAPEETVMDALEKQGVRDFRGKKFGELKEIDKSKVLLSLTYLKRFAVYLVNDIARGRSMDFAIDMTRRLDDLQKQGALAVYLTTVNLEELEKEREEKPFKDGKYWNGDIKTRERMNKINSGEQSKEQNIK